MDNVFRRKRDRYEYYFMKPGPYGWPQPKATERGRDYGAFGSLGSQGWRYIGMTDGMYTFERRSRW